MFKLVFDKNHAIDWESAKIVYSFYDEYRGLVVESFLMKGVPNFKSMQSTLLIDVGSSELILKSEIRILCEIG